MAKVANIRGPQGPPGDVGPLTVVSQSGSKDLTVDDNDFLLAPAGLEESSVYLVVANVVIQVDGETYVQPDESDSIVQVQTAEGVLVQEYLCCPPFLAAHPVPVLVTTDEAGAASLSLSVTWLPGEDEPADNVVSVSVDASMVRMGALAVG